MSQPATKPIAATSRTPLIDLSPLAPAVGRSASKPGKLVSTDMNDTAESRTIVDEPMLLAQVSGTPNISSDNAAKLAVADSCPVIEPGLSDPCGVAGAADAHPAAGGAAWLVGLLPLLALGGGGGGGGGGSAPGPTTLYPSSPPTAPGTVPGPTNINAPFNVLHPIDRAGDNGQKLADFDSNQPSAVFRLVQVSDAGTGATLPGRAAEGASPYEATNYPGTNPATDVLFYLNKTTGEVFLTGAGAAAQCIGHSFTISVEAVANGIVSAQGAMTFTLAPPTSGQVYDFFGNATAGLQIATASSPYDVLQVHQGNADFAQMQFLPAPHGVNAAPAALYVQVDNNFAEIQNHFSAPDTRAVEYLTFTDAGKYYGYDLGTASGLNYYRVAAAESTAASPTVSGTDCNDLLFGSSSTDGHAEVFNGGAGNDLIFADPLFSGSPGRWVSVVNGFTDQLLGGDGNDLLVGGGGVDALSGGAGNDVLIGGYGKDELAGGAGNDVFVFNAPAGAANADTITDFAAGDKLLLYKAVFGADALTGNHLAYNLGTGALSFDGLVLATLANKPLLTLDQTNFIVA